MNKTEKLICAILGAVLAWYIFAEFGKAKTRRIEQAKAVAVATNVVSTAAAPKEEVPAPAPVIEEQVEEKSVPAVEEKVVVLENDQLQLEFSSWGAVVKKATLKQYAKDVGKVSEENPALVFDFSASPLGKLGGIDGLESNAAYELRDVELNSVVFVNAFVTRKYTLGDDYRLTLEETFHRGVTEGTAHADAKPVTLSVGLMQMGSSKNDLLSVDSWIIDPKGGRVVHHCEGDSPLKGYLVGGIGGCGGSKSAADLPRTAVAQIGGRQKWIALKNRFFVTALCSSTEDTIGFTAEVARDLKSSNYRPESVFAAAQFQSVPEKRTSVFFVGPKKQSLLWDLGMKDVMEFGMWRWICYPLVWVLNLFNDFIPGFGIAIILLTILVRILFWPLTHKSTVGMKKMQEIQPKMKEIQAKFKDNPQRMQQETFALYKENKVNPLSSCLPMLIQIPVFIALFNVLRSAVELRYAGFLWISDLSEPESLFSSWFPFGGLNILPILMALTTGLQSALTPSSGDKSQQKMMMIFMPAMMLFMFYSFPSALSLYWFLSNLFSIVQMWMIRRATAKKSEAQSATVEVIDPPQTRQMRRHG